MTNTYAINTTRGKEFEVETELTDMGLKPWVPRQLVNRWVKGKKDVVWYDRPYVGKLVFCVIPAIYWRDVVEIKHVIGKPLEFSRLDLDGMPAHTNKATGQAVAAKYGLRDFQSAVGAEYTDMERKRANAAWTCTYEPGQALTMLKGPFEGLGAEFLEAKRDVKDDFPHLRVEVSLFGRATPIDVSPDMVEAVA